MKFLDIYPLNDELKKLYNEVENKQQLHNINFNSGIDIYTPNNYTVPARSFGFKVPLGIVCRPYERHGYFLLPRSSLGKTPIRLSNSIGLIDFPYTGEIIALVDNISDQDFTLEKYLRYFQIAFPSLEEINFITRDIDDLITTDRGEGFGSSGR